MPELEGDKQQLTTQPERTPLQRARLAPLSAQEFVSGPTLENAQQLSPAQIEQQCFAVLGYLEELSQGGETTFPELAITGNMSLIELEALLDSPTPTRMMQQKKVKGLFLGSEHSEQSTDADEVDQSADPVFANHEAQLRQKITELLAHPQVRRKFMTELQTEIGFFTAAKQPMKEVDTIDRVNRKLRRNIFGDYLASKQEHGKLVQSAADRIRLYEDKLKELQNQKAGITATVPDETLSYIQTQKLLAYKQQLKEQGFVLTPSRERLIERITKEALAGKKIFLVGSTGTGKTELAFYALNELTGGYEIVPWHEGTTPRDIFGYRELWENDEGKVQSGIKPGPYPRALENQKGLIHEEFTGGSTRTQLSMKYLMGARPGDEVHIPGFNGEVHQITPNFIELFTGNPKDERTKQREEMDPAILRELTGIEVSFMPARELYDIIRAMLIGENGVLQLSKSELKFIEQLCKAAEMTQRVHNKDFGDFTPEIRQMLGIDADGNTDITLNTNFLDPGTLFKLFGEWELARARGQQFSLYMQEKLTNFVNDPKSLSAPEERVVLRKILQALGLTTSSSGEVRVAFTKPENEKGYVLPSEMAGNTRAITNPMTADTTNEHLANPPHADQMAERKHRNPRLPDRLPTGESELKALLRDLEMKLQTNTMLVEARNFRNRSASEVAKDKQLINEYTEAVEVVKGALSKKHN